MSRKEEGPLANYNSLTDPHLAAYYSNIRRQKQLRKAGLVTKHGSIVSEKLYRMYWSEQEHRTQIREMVAQAILHKTLDLERMAQVEEEKKLNEIAKLETMSRISSERARRQNEKTFPPLMFRQQSDLDGQRQIHSATEPQRSRSPDYSSRRTTSANDSRMHTGKSLSRSDAASRSYEERPASTEERKRSPTRSASKYRQTDVDDIRLTSLNEQALRDYFSTRRSYQKPIYSPYCEVPSIILNLTPLMPTPPKRRRRRTENTRNSMTNRESSARQNKVHLSDSWLQKKSCTVTMHYYGPKIKLDSDLYDPEDEIRIEQQPAGATSLTVFLGKVLPGTDFEFASLRQREFPFSLTLYINGHQDCRVSTCCETKHKFKKRLGKSGHFSIVSAPGATPCFSFLGKGFARN